MTRDPEADFPKDYRGARKAFIAACGRAHCDAISRVHPALSGKDGKPLFLDSVALGPRDAKKAVLVISNGAAASAAIAALLNQGPKIPKGARLVLVHAFDPFSFAGVKGDPDWSRAMLKAVATEDLARAVRVSVLTLGVGDHEIGAVLARQRPNRRLTVREIGTSDRAALEAAIAAEFSRF